PWGLALAPSTFGPHGGGLLGGNFGSGTIMTFDDNGHFDGFLEAVSGKPIANNGLWALTFGSGNRGGLAGTLDLTAGPEHQFHRPVVAQHRWQQTTRSPYSANRHR